ncbi:unnamed protein product [Lymnaea stagnalis]|uniref:alkaline phosphatase n=1 Tax=Lymnaea stagnalis TaxID=6523 RepID=A0AAV2HGD6_LYMST
MARHPPPPIRTRSGLGLPNLVKFLLGYFLLVNYCIHGFRIQMGDLDQIETQYNAKLIERSVNSAFNIKAAKNVVLFLVEGLDSHTMSIARKIIAENTAEVNNKMAALDNFISGYVKPHGRDYLVADPAAATSAIFNGLPERNGQMGWVEQENSTCFQFVQARKLLLNLYKVMSVAGKQTALLTSSRLTSPGVAGTYASTPDMQLESDIHMRESGCDKSSLKDIAKQLITDYKKLNVIVGSGRNYFQLNTIADEVTGTVLPESRSDLDLKMIWDIDKRLKKATHKKAVGLTAVNDVLASSSYLEYILGFIDTTEKQEVTGLHIRNVIDNFKKKSDSTGYFITVYSDQLARSHYESKAFQVGQQLNAILGAVQEVQWHTKNDQDTLIVVASTQGSTLTLASGTLLKETVTSFSRSDSCEPYTYLTYAFGPKQQVDYDEKTGNTDYQFLSLHRTQGVTGGPDLPIYATGPGAPVFVGINTFSYVYHALLCATCLASNAQRLYRHCQPPASTTTSRSPLTTTRVAPTPWNPFQTTKKPQPQPSWPWVVQPKPQISPNPYSGLGDPSNGNVAPPPLPNPPFLPPQTNPPFVPFRTPAPTPRPNNNNNNNNNNNLQNNPWGWASLFPFFF